jgi:hypothetical protein
MTWNLFSKICVEINGFFMVEVIGIEGVPVLTTRTKIAMSYTLAKTRQTETDRQTDTQTDRHIDRQTYKQTDIEP